MERPSIRLGCGIVIFNRLNCYLCIINIYNKQKIMSFFLFFLVNSELFFLLEKSFERKYNQERERSCLTRSPNASRIRWNQHPPSLCNSIVSKLALNLHPSAPIGDQTRIHCWWNLHDERERVSSTLNVGDSTLKNPHCGKCMHTIHVPVYSISTNISKSTFQSFLNLPNKC